MQIFISLLLCFATSLESFAEYLYPVGVIDDENLLLIHQVSLDSLELWLWNIKENVAVKELNSSFLPSCVQVLPSKKGCSFIDRGRMKIKYFNKRTPRVIDFSEPIYAISSITWITEELFYFSGKYEGRFKLFLCDIANRNCATFCLSNTHDNVDYLYPQKIDDLLFCITKTKDQIYAICKTDWQTASYKNQGSDFDEYALFSTLTTSDQPLCFLFMIDKNHGFCLKFTQSENRKDDFFKFICCKAQQGDDGSWSLSELFDFELPKKLLVGSSPERLYDSIYPFLPFYTEESIYFSNFNHTSQVCEIACYNNFSGQIELNNLQNSRSLCSASHLFAPCRVNNSMYCGISTSIMTPNRSLMLSDQTSGIFKCMLPEIKF